jgi:hypothetical protein
MADVRNQIARGFIVASMLALVSCDDPLLPQGLGTGGQASINGWSINYDAAEGKVTRLFVARVSRSELQDTCFVIHGDANALYDTLEERPAFWHRHRDKFIAVKEPGGGKKYVVPEGSLVFMDTRVMAGIVIQDASCEAMTRFVKPFMFQFLTRRRVGSYLLEMAREIGDKRLIALSEEMVKNDGNVNEAVVSQYGLCRVTELSLEDQ